MRARCRRVDPVAQRAGGFTLIAAVVCALATAGMVVAVFSPIRTIPASADWERGEA